MSFGHFAFLVLPLAWLLGFTTGRRRHLPPRHESWWLDGLELYKGELDKYAKGERDWPGLHFPPGVLSGGRRRRRRFSRRSRAFTATKSGSALSVTPPPGLYDGPTPIVRPSAAGFNSCRPHSPVSEGAAILRQRLAGNKSTAPISFGNAPASALGRLHAVTAESEPA